ncbi:hypothetical protein ACH5RR_033335 [Cinchona calisaya]|uniref:Uncharacterized protein n=1 Tax=Cinchona calisaya TaxID=153742 RepID=A0ABD2YLU5_9GENT
MVIGCRVDGWNDGGKREGLRARNNLNVILVIKSLFNMSGEGMIGEGGRRREEVVGELAVVSENSLAYKYVEEKEEKEERDEDSFPASHCMLFVLSGADIGEPLLSLYRIFYCSLVVQLLQICIVG